MLRTALFALVVAGCSSSAPQPMDGDSGLPILDALPPFARSMAATEWNESEGTPAGFGPDDTGHADLGSLTEALRVLWGEQDMQVTMGFIGRPTADAATIVVHATGRDREDIVGDELVMEARRNERGWYLELVRHRMHCRVGIDPDTEFCA